MKAEYQRELHHNYLVLSEEEGSCAEEFELRMISENQIPGFLNCQVRRIDQKEIFYYEITSRQSLKEHLTDRKAQKQLLELLFSAVSEAADRLPGYLLAPSGLLLDPEYIFLNAGEDQVWFCYCPAVESTLQEQLKLLSEFLLLRLDHEDKNAVVAGYAFYQQCMQKEPDTDLFRKILHQQEEKTVPEEDPEAEQREQLLDQFFAPEEPEEEQMTLRRKIFPGLIFAAAGAGFFFFRLAGYPAAGAGLAAGIGIAGGFIWKRTEKEEKQEDDSVQPAVWYEDGEAEKRTFVNRKEFGWEGDSDETVLLDADTGRNRETGSRRRAVLIPEEDRIGEKMVLTEDTYLIGKSRAAADLVIDSPTVSRLHAKLQWNQDTYQIQDLHSRNGTFVNETELSAEEIKTIRDGDRIRFAGSSYIFSAEGFADGVKSDILDEIIHTGADR